jgi:hypothetical protein
MWWKWRKNYTELEVEPKDVAELLQSQDETVTDET